MNLTDLFERMTTLKPDIYFGIASDDAEITPNTPTLRVGVTSKPAPTLALTPITPITPKIKQLVDLAAPWSDQEVLLTKARTERFINKGGGSDSADVLACNLVARDRQLDDRRTCYECEHLLYTCTQGLEPVGGDRTVLHRCIKFLEDSHDRTA